MWVENLPQNIQLRIKLHTYRYHDKQLKTCTNWIKTNVREKREMK